MFKTSSLTEARNKWTEEKLGSVPKFWMMLGAEAFSKLPQPQRLSVISSIMERGRFQKVMREENNV